MREARPAASRMAHAFTIPLLQENAPHPAVSPTTRRRPWPDGLHAYALAPASVSSRPQQHSQDAARLPQRQGPGSKLAMSPVRYRISGMASRLSVVSTTSPVSPQGSGRPSRGSTTSSRASRAQKMIAVMGRAFHGAAEAALRQAVVIQQFAVPGRAQPLPQVRVKPVRAGKHSAQVRRRGLESRAASLPASGAAAGAWGRCSASQWAREASPAGSCQRL